MINHHQQLLQEVTARAESAGILQAEAFFDVTTEWLVEIGVFSEAHYSQHRQTGVQIDGYGGNLADEDDAIKLILLDYSPTSEGVETLTATDLNAVLKRASNFISKSLKREFIETLEESTDAYKIARTIFENLSKIRKIQLFLITNRALSNRVKEIKLTDVGDIPLTITVWDMRRFSELYEQGSEREPLTVDFEELGYEVNALPANYPGSKFASYLSVLPGEALADIYDDYGTRLLEQNVRVFLQARGKVNKGIQGTILDEPEMFFAYNNGITATAEEIVFKENEGQLFIQKILNLQIVNGGQTAASIYRMSKYSKKFWKKGQEPSLKKVYVQMKISVVPPEKALAVVPKISRYSNSQNKVSDADFFSNHPYHVEIENIAKKVLASTREGTVSSTKWFYERMRGQYNNEKAKFTGAQQKEFAAKNPRNQMFTKTDLAKFLLVWEGKPEVAALGAAKSFNKFAVMIGERWDQNNAFVNEHYFKECVAKGIIFRQTEKIVSAQRWYEGGGDRAPIVIHTLGKLAADMKAMKMTVDFMGIWNRQDLSPQERDAITLVAEIVKDAVRNPPGEGMLSTEWAKRADCTKAIAGIEISYPAQFLKALISMEDHRADTARAKAEQKNLNGWDAQALVISQRPKFWVKVREWAIAREYLNPKERDLLEVASNNPLPTEKQALAIMEIYQRLAERNCPQKLDTSTSLK